jgi:ATP-binding cassette subfamily B protein
MGWIVWRALHGSFTLGDVALVYQALQRAQGLTRALLGNLSQVYTSTLFLAKLFAFLDLKPQIVDPPEPVGVPMTLERGVTFRNVTFRYPGSERLALQDFNLTIRPNTIAAIVGPNGAGKSTLIKLLCRFYDPTAGRIEVDGTDIRQFALDDLRRLMTLLFEFPVAYQATAGENIALGDLRDAPGRLEIESAARSAGADEIIARLPQGYATPLGKWFTEGAELSGGEWQRVATARAFLRRSQIIVLDEPTSMVDSWAEADWFERVRALARGRTALIISHRFTLAMRADVIHVMNQGRIVESGSHSDLIAGRGLYAKSWTAQMRAARPDAGAPTDGQPSAPLSESSVQVVGSGVALG